MHSQKDVLTINVEKKKMNLKKKKKSVHTKLTFSCEGCVHIEEL